MKPQILISIFVSITAIVVGFSGIRFYPFSDYPMFAYQVKDLSTYTLTIKQKDKPDIAITNRTLFPLTRLNLMQTIWMTKKGVLPNFDWAESFSKKIKKKYPLAEQMSLQKIEFSPGHDPSTNYKVLETIWTTLL